MTVIFKPRVCKHGSQTDVNELSCEEEHEVMFPQQHTIL